MADKAQECLNLAKRELAYIYMELPGISTQLSTLRDLAGQGAIDGALVACTTTEANWDLLSTAMKNVQTYLSDAKKAK